MTIYYILIGIVLFKNGLSMPQTYNVFRYNKPTKLKDIETNYKKENIVYNIFIYEPEKSSKNCHQEDIRSQAVNAHNNRNAYSSATSDSREETRYSYDSYTAPSLPIRHGKVTNTNTGYNAHNSLQDYLPPRTSFQSHEESEVKTVSEEDNERVEYNNDEVEDDSSDRRKEDDGDDDNEEDDDSNEENVDDDDDEEEDDDEEQKINKGSSESNSGYNYRPPARPFSFYQAPTSTIIPVVRKSGYNYNPPASSLNTYQAPSITSAPVVKNSGYNYNPPAKPFNSYQAPSTTNAPVAKTSGYNYDPPARQFNAYQTPSTTNAPVVKTSGYNYDPPARPFNAYQAPSTTNAPVVKTSGYNYDPPARPFNAYQAPSTTNAPVVKTSGYNYEPPARPFNAYQAPSTTNAPVAKTSGYNYNPPAQPVRTYQIPTSTLPPTAQNSGYNYRPPSVPFNAYEIPEVQSESEEDERKQSIGKYSESSEDNIGSAYTSQAIKNESEEETRYYARPKSNAQVKDISEDNYILPQTPFSLYGAPAKSTMHDRGESSEDNFYAGYGSSLFITDSGNDDSEEDEDAESSYVAEHRVSPSNGESEGSDEGSNEGGSEEEEEENNKKHDEDDEEENEEERKHSEEKEEYEKPKMMLMPYNFEWSVSDEEAQVHFGHQEESDGILTQGQYRVQLPDGRTQIVTFNANGDDGYQADVQYEK